MFIATARCCSTHFAEGARAHGRKSGVHTVGNSSIYLCVMIPRGFGIGKTPKVVGMDQKGHLVFIDDTATIQSKQG